MARFIAVHPAAFTEEQLQALAKETPPEGTTWHATFCAFDDNTSYCHWVAPSAEVLIGVFTKYEIPYTTLHVVRLFDPATGTLEA
jgi:hypothetical protein